MATKKKADTPKPASVQQSLVSERAIVQRINRALTKRGQKLIKSKGAHQLATLGEWHIADEGQGGIVAANVSLADLARQEGVLQSWEAIYLVADATESKKTPSTYHPVVGFIDGPVIRGDGGLTHDQAMATAQAMADKSATDDQVDFIGAGVDRVLKIHVEK